MQKNATALQVDAVVSHLEQVGYDVHRSAGADRTILGVVHSGPVDDDPRLIEIMDGVQEVVTISEPYKLASRAFRPAGTVITIDDVRIGGDEVIVMAGPCSAETEEQVHAAAAAVRRAGGQPPD